MDAEQLSSQDQALVREAWGYCPTGDGLHYTVGVGSTLVARLLEVIRAERRGAFQAEVLSWAVACLGSEIAADRLERSDRFIEEALELVQAGGYSRERAHSLVDYVFDRPAGEAFQEIGGVMVTLAAWCNAAGLGMAEGAEAELARISDPEVMARIQAKQKAKPTGSALPQAAPAARATGGVL